MLLKLHVSFQEDLITVTNWLLLRITFAKLLPTLMITDGFFKMKDPFLHSEYIDRDHERESVKTFEQHMEELRSKGWTGTDEPHHAFGDEIKLMSVSKTYFPLTVWEGLAETVEKYITHNTDFSMDIQRNCFSDPVYCSEFFDIGIVQV